MYIFVHDIDGLYGEFINRNVKIGCEIGDRDYDMRNFDIIDPDGHRITFGCSLESPDQAS